MIFDPAGVGGAGRRRAAGRGGGDAPNTGGMDLLADDLALSPPALSLLAAYDAAVKDAAAQQTAETPSPQAAGAAGDDDADDDAPDDDAESLEEPGAAAPPKRRKPAVPRLAPETVPDLADDADAAPADLDRAAADLHGLLLAAGALDVDLSDVAAGVRYRVTRAGRGMLAKAA